MIKPFQPGLIPLGHFDFDDSQLSLLVGGEVAVLDKKEVSVVEKAATDIYVDTDRTGFRLATGDDLGPFFFTDPSANGGGLSGITTEQTSLFSSAFSTIAYESVSSKATMWGTEGFYIVSTNALENTITESTEPNTPLYVSDNGKLTAAISSSNRVVGYFAEYRKKSVAREKLYNLPGTERSTDVIVVYKINADGYLTLDAVSSIILGSLKLGTPTDGYFSDGYFGFTADTLIADAIDEISEYILNNPVTGGTSAPTGNDGYAWIELGGVADWRPILARYIIAAFDILSFSITSSTQEVGQSLVAPAFTATYNRSPTTAVLTNNSDSESKNVISTPTTFSSSNTFTKTANNATVTFTLSCSENGDTDTAQSTIAWRPRVYYGASATVIDTQAEILALASSALQSSKATTITVTAGSGEYIWYVIPSSYGTPVFTVNGFSGGVSLTSSGVSVTNTYGNTQNYDIWRTDNPSLGLTTLVIT